MKGRIMIKRVLWLIREQIVYHSDVPALREMGYEVYTVQCTSWRNKTWGWFFPENEPNQINLPEGIREKLDDLDFVQELSAASWDIVNSHFDLVFLDYCKPQYRQFLEHFKGTIVFRPSEVPKDGYAAIMMRDYGMEIFHLLDQRGKRFWFAPVFKEDVKKEANILSRRFLALPLKPACNIAKKKTKGEHVLVACPGINVLAGQDAIYRDVVSLLRKSGNIPYVICGRQFNNTAYDQNIHGDVSENQFLEDLNSSSFLFIPRGVKGNLLYYITFAVNHDIPVLMPRDSVYAKVLSSNEGTASGVYMDDEDAIHKIRLAGKKGNRFPDDLAEAQKQAFEKYFKPEDFRKNFIRAIKAVETESTANQWNQLQNRHIGIVLQGRYSQTMILQLQMLLKHLNSAQLDTDKVRFLLGYPESVVLRENDEPEDEEEEIEEEPKTLGFDEHFEELAAFEKMDIALRGYVPEEKNRKWLQNMLEMKGYPKADFPEPFFVLNDHNTFFEECDALLIIINADKESQEVPSRIVSSRPFSVYITDSMFIPQMEPHSLLVKAGGLLCQARSIFCQNESIRRYLTCHLGLNRDRIFNIGSQLMPFPTDKEASGQFIQNDSFLYFAGEGNEAQAELLNAFLMEYYLNGGCRSAIIIGYDWLKGFSITVRCREQFISGVTNDYEYDQYIYSNERTERISVNTLASLIGKCDFALLPEYFDMYGQMISWLLEKGKRFACREPYEKKYLALPWAELQLLRNATLPELMESMKALEEKKTAFSSLKTVEMKDTFRDAVRYAFPFLCFDPTGR